MPSFAYVNHEWLVDIVVYKALPLVSYPGLVVFYLVLVALAYLISAGKSGLMGNSLESGTVFLLAMAPVSAYFGVRPQIITWLLLAVLLQLLYKVDLWRKWRWATPLLFLCWANLHGGFSAGLTALVLVVGTRIVTQKRIDFYDLAIVGFCFLATLINPYGTGLWGEVWSSVSDHDLRYRISEWRPFVFAADVSIVGIVGLSAGAIWHFRSKIASEKIVVYLFFLIQAFSSNRNIPLWVVSAVPVTVESLGLFGESLGNGKIAKERYRVAMRTLFLMAVFIFIMRGCLSLKDGVSLREDVFYPGGAVEYLSATSLEGNLFSEYGWAGYLIWKYPGRRVFIDGRMPSWHNENAPQSESKSAADDYFDILQGDISIEEQFEKYNIKTVLWRAQRPPDTANKLEVMLLNIVFGEEAAKTGIDIQEKLIELGWWESYRDGKSVVYRK
jgi:hypothetical protein